MISCPVDAIIASTLLMGVVLLIRAPVRRIFGPTVAYALWALPALRMLLPPLPESWREAGATPITQASEVVYQVAAAPEMAVATGLDGPDYAAIAAAIWAAVAGVFLLYHLLQYAVFRARLLRRHEPVDRIGGVRVVLSPAAPGPLAFGVLERYVALPADLDARYDGQEQALALAHELGHHARGDLLANWAALTVLALHWWNPIAWIAHRAFRADQELANDARVLRQRGPDAAHAYACAILKAAHGGSIAAACHLHTVNDLKGRLRMLKSRPVTPRRLLAGAATVGLIATTGLGLTASGYAATAAVKASVGETIGVDLDAVQLDLPEPPSPPTPPEPVTAPEPPALPNGVRAVRSPAQPPRPTPAPPAPLALAPVPPIPPVPPVPSVDGHQHLSVIRKDGRVVRRIISGPHGPAIHLSDVPEVRERRCGGGEQPMVRHESRGGKRVTIICTDRIERMAERHAEQAERHAELAANSDVIRRQALEGALRGLRGARESVVATPNLTSEQRRLALAGIEESIREMESDLRQAD